MAPAGFCVDFVSPQAGARVAAYDLAIGLPAFAFLAFLAWHHKPSMRKLRHSRSHMMSTYYGFLWAVTLLNSIRCLVQMLQLGGAHTTLVNTLWLLTRFGMTLLEVSVVVFLMQGYAASGRQALLQTLTVSGSAAGLETLVKALYIFVLHIPLYTYGGAPSDPRGGDMARSKWSFWLLRALLAALVYGAVLVLPYTAWRDMLPGKAAFFQYVWCLLPVYLALAVGAALLVGGVGAGYCVYGAASWAYYAAYPPLLYWFFLAEFFSDDQLDMDLLYYSEMRDAGCFEEDE